MNIGVENENRTDIVRRCDVEGASPFIFLSVGSGDEGASTVVKFNG